MSKAINSAFLLFVVLYMLGLFYVVDFLWLLKIIPIGILGIGVFNTQNSIKRTVLLVALVFSACGDLLLAFDEFIYGVAAFLLAQLSYALIFKTYWQGLTTRWALSIGLLIYMLLMAWLLLPNLGNLKIPVMAYLLAIGVMGFLAAQSSLRLCTAVLGALVFIVSDSLIAVNKFLYSLPYESYWIMTSYYAAQFMMIKGLIVAGKQQKEEGLNIKR